MVAFALCPDGIKMSARSAPPGHLKLITPPVELTTSRLHLRAARSEHAASVFTEYTGNSMAARFLPRGAHPAQSSTEAVIHAWGESNWADGDRFIWSIIDRSDQRPMGLFLMFVDGDGAEIHYGIGPAYWGRGWRRKPVLRLCIGSSSSHPYPRFIPYARLHMRPAAVFSKRLAWCVASSCLTPCC